MAAYTHGTGALLLTPDPRDWSAFQHPAIAAAIDAGVPDTVALGGSIGSVYDQGAEGACVAFSEAGAVSREETVQGRPWVVLDAENLYRRNGGTGANGVDTRQTLQDIVSNGINRLDGGPPIHEKSYMFVPKDPLVWEQTIMAALSVGKPVTLATYLPAVNGSENFGWNSDGTPNPQRYHQIYLDGGDPEWWTFVNSWGPGFGQNGRGRIKKSYVDPNRADVYAYIIEPGDSVIPPPPPPPPPNVRKITGSAVGIAQGVGSNLFAVGQSIPVASGAFTGTISITQIDDGNVLPPPPPPPPPPPGTLKVNIARGRGYLAANVMDGSKYLQASCDLVLGGVDKGTRPTTPSGATAIAAIWSAANVPAGTLAVVNVTAADGRTGQGSLTL